MLVKKDSENIQILYSSNRLLFLLLARRFLFTSHDMRELRLRTLKFTQVNCPLKVSGTRTKRRV